MLKTMAAIEVEWSSGLHLLTNRSDLRTNKFLIIGSACDKSTGSQELYCSDLLDETTLNSKLVFNLFVIL